LMSSLKADVLSAILAHLQSAVSATGAATTPVDDTSILRVRGPIALPNGARLTSNNGFTFPVNKFWLAPRARQVDLLRAPPGAAPAVQHRPRKDAASPARARRKAAVPQCAHIWLPMARFKTRDDAREIAWWLRVHCGRA